MDMTTFRQALEVAKDHGDYIVLGGGEPTLHGDYIVLGGGEPTLHPHFEKMLLESLAVSDEISPLVVTNGTHKRRALMLAQLADKEVISAALSTDAYHDLDMISNEVWEAFESRQQQANRKGTRREFQRDVSGKEVNVGRWLETNAIEWEEVDHKDCACDSWIVEPDGTIKQCACHDAPIVGNVKGEGIFPKYNCCSGMCFHSGEFAEEMEDFDEMIERAVA
jgi:MoaA/NifB/PqqE/SkfB family radical SAM enzyme